MQYVLLNKQVFRVDDGYLDEPSDNLYPLYPLDSDEPVGTMRADILQQIGFKIPPCYKEIFEKRVYAQALKEYESIDVRVVLRLITNSETYVHYLISPVLVDDITVREGGQYFAFKDDADGNPVLYGADTGLLLQQCLNANIPAAKNRQLVVLNDSYFVEALRQLKEMHLLKDTCAAPLFVSQAKIPGTVILPPGYEEDNHPPHCEWCIANGEDGFHGWNNDGTGYNNGTTTTCSHYQRISN